MKKRYTIGSLLPALFASRQSLFVSLLLFCGGLIPSAVMAQTTYDFSGGATISKLNASDFYNLKAEFTSGGVTYVVSGGMNGSFAVSSTNGFNNTACLKKDAANAEYVSIKRKDGKAFTFYGLWVKYTNGTYGTGPGFKMDYKFGCGTVKTVSNAALNATYTQSDAAGVVVNELTLSFSYLITFYIDNIITGVPGNLPPVITPSICSDQTVSLTIPSNSTDVTTVVATDDNGDPLTYSLSGADAAKFSIDATGKLSFKSIPVLNPPGDANGDGTYTVVVTVSDGKGGSDSQTINVNIQQTDIAFKGCDIFTGVTAFLKRTNSLDVIQSGITRYGYCTPQSFMDANYYHINIRWNAATSKWIITTEDDYYGTTIMYTSSKASYPYPPDITNGAWVANNNLPDGIGSCGTMTTLSGQVSSKPAATTANTTAQDLTGTTAKLTGTVSDAYNNTSVSFDYGTSPTLATFQTVAATPAVVNAGAGATAVSAAVSGLQQKTTYYFRVKGTNSLGTTTGSIQSFTTPSILPVTLLQLDARKESNGTVAITWTTAAETNSRSYLVERSNDGISFQAIGQVDAKGNTSNVSAYRFIDAAPLAGAGYYRVSQTDIDGHTKLLGIRKVDVKKAAMVQVYPNPTQSNQLWIYSNTASEKLSYSLVEFSGRVLLRGTLTNASTMVSTAGFAKGIYLLEISNGQKLKVDIR